MAHEITNPLIEEINKITKKVVINNVGFSKEQSIELIKKNAGFYTYVVAGDNIYIEYKKGK